MRVSVKVIKRLDLIIQPAVQSTCTDQRWYALYVDDTIMSGWAAYYIP